MDLDDEPPHHLWIQCRQLTFSIPLSSIANISKAQTERGMPETMFSTVAEMDSGFFDAHTKDHPFKIEPLSSQEEVERQVYLFLESYFKFYECATPQLLLDGCDTFSALLERARDLFQDELVVYGALLRPFHKEFFEFICLLLKAAEYHSLVILQKNICFLISAHINDPLYRSLILSDAETF